MSDLRTALHDYLKLRRQLGFELKTQGRLLESYVRFMERAGAQHITTELALVWAKLPVHARAHTWRQRLGTVRGFARYMATIDPLSEVPSKDLLPARGARVAPYLYSPAEIAALMDAARMLTPPMRAATYETLIGLMATTGLRLGEAVGLDRTDVNLEDGVLHVRRAKQDKQREVPLHASTTAALREYSRLRDRHCAALETAAFFVTRLGVRLTSSDGPLHVPDADPPGRPGRTRGAPPTAPARSQTCVCCPHAAGLVSRRRSGRTGAAAALDVSRSRRPVIELLVFPSGARAARARRATARRLVRAIVMSLIAPTLQAFFTDRLITQRNASPRTVAAYRDTLRLFLRFAHQQTGKQPARLDFADLDAPLIGAFLDHLEHERGNTARTRNARLAAIHSLYRYAALRHPEHAATIGRVIEIPAKRHERALISYLDLDEIKALLPAPDRTTWLGRRDHALLLTAIQTGLRVSELVGLRISDVSLGAGAHVRTVGKGRKERCATLTRETVAVLREWLQERDGDPTSRCSRHGEGATHPRTVACYSTSTSPPQPTAARRSHASASPRTSSGTPTRCSCAPRTSTSSRSRCGSATRAPSPPRSISTLTTSSNSRRSTDRPDRYSTRPIPTRRHAPGVPGRTVIIRGANPATPPLNRQTLTATPLPRITRNPG